MAMPGTKFISKYKADVVTLYDMIRSVIAFRMPKREVNPDMVRLRLSDPMWMEAHLVDFYRLENGDWEDWSVWVRQEFGYTPEAMAALCDKKYPPCSPQEPVDASLGVV